MSHSSRIDSTKHDAPAAAPPFWRRKRILTAGVAMASASAVALAPLQMERVDMVQADSYDLTAAAGPLGAYQELLDETLATLFTSRPADPPTRPSAQPALTAASAEAFAKLAKSLSDPAAQARLTSFFSNSFSDPQRIPNALQAAPGKYGPGLEAALAEVGATNQTAFAGLYSDRHARNRVGRPLYEWVDANGETQILSYDPNNDRYFLGENGTEQVSPDPDDLTKVMKPGVFQEALRILSEGSQVAGPDGELVDARFVEAFSEFNMWLLIDVLGDSRADALGIVRYPGDFLEDLGFETLGRILGTSWMDDAANAKPGWANAGLLSRGRLGNAARAMIAPQIGAIYRTMMVLDTVNNALKDGDVQTAVFEVVSAPANITNVFLNGFQMFHNDKYEDMPGLFSPRSTFNFILNEVPSDIANVLTMKKPEPVAPPTVPLTDPQALRVVADEPDDTSGPAELEESTTTPESLELTAPATTEQPAVDLDGPVDNTTPPVDAPTGNDSADTPAGSELNDAPADDPAPANDSASPESSGDLTLSGQ